MPPSNGSHDPSEVREVDRLLRQLNPGEVARPPLTRTSPGFRRGPTPPRTSVRSPSATLTPFTVWSRVLLGAVLAGAMTQWPYATCGLALAAYLFAAAVVIWMGVWGSFGAWRARLGRAHLLGIGTLIAGLALAALQLLSRVGYAGLSMPWRCAG